MERSFQETRGANFSPRAPVGVMTRQSPAENDRSESVEELLRSFGREGWRGGTLRAQLTERFPDRAAEDIEDAVQTACLVFLAEGKGITDPRAAFAWIRTVAQRSLIHELRRRRRAVSVDPSEVRLQRRSPRTPVPPRS